MSKIWAHGCRLVLTQLQHRWEAEMWVVLTATLRTSLLLTEWSISLFDFGPHPHEDTWLVRTNIRTSRNQAVLGDDNVSGPADCYFQNDSLEWWISFQTQGRIAQNSLRTLEIRNADKPIGTNSWIFVTKLGLTALANNIINLNNYLLCDVQADRIKTNASSDMIKE